MFDPFMRTLGIEGEVTAPGQARVWGPVQPGYLNNWGSAHGGFLYTLADAEFALASNSHGALAVPLCRDWGAFRATRYLHFGVLCPLAVIGLVTALSRREYRTTPMLYYVAMLASLALPAVLRSQRSEDARQASLGMTHP